MQLLPLASYFDLLLSLLDLDSGRVGTTISVLVLTRLGSGQSALNPVPTYGTGRVGTGYHVGPESGNYSSKN